MASTIKLTSKRQVTFPAEVCESLGVGAGDRLVLTSMMVKGRTVWMIEPPQPDDSAWFGALHKYARGRSHDMAAIRASIAAGRRRERK
jgi:bifunctional DNA-binding transcriptional regulator/antitoxin component of YhaV-PrlF toxin-antitoxin module